MLVRALLLRVPILQVLSDKKISNRADILLDLSAAQWALAEDLVKVLHPFEVATTVMSAEYNVSLLCVLPCLYKGVSPSTDDLQAIVLFKEILQKELNRKSVCKMWNQILCLFWLPFWIHGLRRNLSPKLYEPKPRTAFPVE